MPSGDYKRSNLTPKERAKLNKYPFKQLLRPYRNKTIKRFFKTKSFKK